MKITIKCSCGNQKTYTLSEYNDQTITTSYRDSVDKFEISRHDDASKTMGQIDCLKCLTWAYM